MNSNRNVSFGTGAGPSVSEVESAMFRPEVVRAEPVTVLPRRSDVMRRLDDLKSRSLSKVHDVQSNVQHSMMAVKTSARTGVSTGVATVQRSMRTSPAKWAGIAAASGFALGMLGRLVRARREHQHHLPQLIIVETRF